MQEEEIINGCLKNNAICQRVLFDMYSRILMSVCLRYANDTAEAEDMLQESFIKIFAAIHQYRYEGSLEGWLKKVTINTCLRKLQRATIRFEDTSIAESLSDTIHPNAISSLTEKELIKMISNLPNGYRIVFNLRVIEGYSHEEIAAMLGIEQVTSRSQLIKARRMLQKQILSFQKIIL